MPAIKTYRDSMTAIYIILIIYGVMLIVAFLYYIIAVHAEKQHSIGRR